MQNAAVELWVIITIAAALLQNVRSLLQKRLTGRLSVNGAAYVRFVYALPFAWLFLGALSVREQVPAATPEFLVYAFVGGIAQIVGTSALLASFNYRNFTVGTAFSKTETAQAALFGLVLLDDTLSVAALAGIAVSLVGVLMLSVQGGWRQLGRFDRATALGLLSGAGFAIAAVSYRGGALSLEAGTTLMRAITTLAATLVIQTVVFSVYLRLREAGELTRVLTQWRVAGWVGLIGMVGSAGWFTAMTLESAALVRAVGQVELLFTFATSVWLLKERVHAREILGALLVVGGIYLLL